MRGPGRPISIGLVRPSLVVMVVMVVVVVVVVVVMVVMVEVCLVAVEEDGFMMICDGSSLDGGRGKCCGSVYVLVSVVVTVDGCTLFDDNVT